MIYFIKLIEKNYVKAGLTERDVKVRFNELQSVIPFKLELIGCMEGDRTKERYIKKRFEHLNISPSLTKTEWFRGDEEFMEYIDANINE